MRPGGPVVGATRLPFSWKFSPYLCQRILGDLLRRLVPQDVELLHYLDDFVLVLTDRPLLHGTTQECVRLLVENRFIVSDKSTLEPVQHLFVLGKVLDLQRRMIYSHRRAWLQILATWLRLAVSPIPGPKLIEKLLGFIQWHIRPRLTSAPLLAGAYCWVRWGDHDRNVPVKILHALASALCLCAEPYRALPWERARKFISLPALLYLNFFYAWDHGAGLRRGTCFRIGWGGFLRTWEPDLGWCPWHVIHSKQRSWQGCAGVCGWLHVCDGIVCYC